MQQDITKEHCDGNRNLLHTCVAMCAPTSNKDYDQGNKYKTFNNWNWNNVFYLTVPVRFLDNVNQFLLKHEKILLHSWESHDQKYFLQQISL